MRLLVLSPSLTGDSPLNITTEPWKELLGLFTPPKNVYTPSITVFGLRGDLPLEMWRMCFQRLVSLITLNTAGTRYNEQPQEYASFNCLAVLEEAGQEDSNHVNTPFVPHLKILEWESILVDRRMIQRLLQMVKKRSKLGVPLQELIFTDVYCDGNADIEELSNYAEITIRSVNLIPYFSKLV